MNWRFWQPKKKPQRMISRAYAGAKFDRLTADWVAMSTSADSEIKGSLPALRARSRQLGRDNDYAKSAFREVQVNVVGIGFGFQAKIKKQRGGDLHEDLNSQVESKWRRWKRKQHCDVTGLQAFDDIERHCMRAIVENGEVLIRKIQAPFGGSKIPFALELIESDMLDDNYNGLEANGNAVRMGVEIDKWGRPVAYHILRKHPGDYQFGMTNRQERGRDRVRVPANEIIHLFIRERTGQTRGVPWLHAAMTRIRHMGGYEEAEIIAARGAASLMGFIETEEGELQGDDVDAGQRVTEFEPGMFKQMKKGEKVNVPNIARPGTQFDPFMRMMIRGIASSIGGSYSGIASDFSQSSYSSMRQEKLSVQDTWRIIQKWLEGNFHQAIFEAWLDMAVLSGELSLPKFDFAPEEYYEACKWQPRGWAWVDPEKEVAAYRLAVASGFMTQGEVVGEMGGDLNELITQRASEIKLAESKGLYFESQGQKKTAPEADPKAGKPAKEPAKEAKTV